MTRDSSCPPAREPPGLFVVAGVVAAVAIVGLAAVPQMAGWAPFGLIAIAAGVALGVALHRLAVIGRLHERGKLILVAVVLSLVAVAAEHVSLYLGFRQQWHEAREVSSQIALFRPEEPWSPAEYFAKEFSPRSVALWATDATLLTTAAVATVWLLQRRDDESLHQHE